MNSQEFGALAIYSDSEIFESFLLDLEIGLERIENSSHPGLKAHVRQLCAYYASSLGLTSDEAAKATMYFHSYIHEDPEKAKRNWELLFELSQNSSDVNKANEIVDELISNSMGGVTLLWQLIERVVKGNSRVMKLDKGNGSIYYLEDFDATEIAGNYGDWKRQNVHEFLEGKFRGQVVPKAVPDYSDSADKLSSPEEKEHFYRLYEYLGNDVDVLVSWPESHGEIERYLTGSTKYIISIIESFELRDGSRKNVYTEFVKRLLARYTLDLRRYCQEMTGDLSHQNRFVSDILLENYYLTHGLLGDDYEEPTPAVFETKWKDLVGTLQTLVRAKTTEIYIPVIELPPGFDEGDNGDDLG